MKNRKSVPMLFVIFSLFLLNGCGEKKYGDAEKVINDYATVMEEMANSLDKATSASDVAKAFNNCADKMETILPAMQKINEKYPELNDENNLPEVLKDEQKRATEIAQKLAGSLMKLMPYMDDPEVQKAQQHMNEITKKLQN